MAQKPKITTGPNDRPLNETIAQSGGGLPDDSGSPVDVEESAIKRVRRQLQGGPGGNRTKGQTGNPEEVPSDTTGAGENICRRCAGTGKVDGATCPDCGGSGKVVTPIGGA
jgi:hypothetical protein